MRAHEQDSRSLAAQRIERARDRFDLHDHAGPAAVRSVVCGTMFVGRPRPQIHRLKGGETLFLRALEHAFAQHALANAGKNGENLDFQRISLKGITDDASKCSKFALNKKDLLPGRV